MGLLGPSNSRIFGTFPNLLLQGDSPNCLVVSYLLDFALGYSQFPLPEYVVYREFVLQYRIPYLILLPVQSQNCVVHDWQASLRLSVDTCLIVLSLLPYSAILFLLLLYDSEYQDKCYLDI